MLLPNPEADRGDPLGDGNFLPAGRAESFFFLGIPLLMVNTNMANMSSLDLKAK